MRCQLVLLADHPAVARGLALTLVSSRDSPGLNARYAPLLEVAVAPPGRRWGGNVHGRHRSPMIGLILAVALLATAWGAAGAAAAGGKPKATAVTGAGDLSPQLEKYRELLGDDNGGAPTSSDSGRREIDWDAVPDEFAAPNALPS